jgi:hypothetical protein
MQSSVERQLTPFADDPVRSVPLSVSADHIQPLFGTSFLSTTLVDFILQHAMKDIIQTDYPLELLIPRGGSR